MRRVWTKLVIFLAVWPLAGCGDTDVANRSSEIEPGQEVEDMGLERDVEPVDLDTLPWVLESGVITFHDRTWFLAGEPIYDPDVTRVGEYRGTPLYAEVGVAPPYDALFIPLEDDYWQMLEEGGAPPPDTSANTGTAEIR